MSDHDLEWWKARATRRYREAQRVQAQLDAVRAALEKHADCWPDDPRSELADDIRAALEPA